MIRSLMAVLLVASTVAMPVAASQPDRTLIDDDHDLTTQQSIDQFRSEGHVATELRPINARLGIAETHAAVGVDGWYSDINAVWIRLRYREGIERTVRIFIPVEYVRPRIAKGKEPVTDGPTADFEPSANREYMIMTVDLSGPTDAVYRLSVERGVVSSGRSGIVESVENTTNTSLPSLTDAGPRWSYVRPSALQGGNATVALPADAGQDPVIQRNVGTADDPRWVAVPDCSQSLETVCRFERNGSPHVLSPTGDPPAVRFASQAGPVADIMADLRDLAEVPSRIAADVRSLIGGIL